MVRSKQQFSVFRIRHRFRFPYENETNPVLVRIRMGRENATHLRPSIGRIFLAGREPATDLFALDDVDKCRRELWIELSAGTTRDFSDRVVR